MGELGCISMLGAMRMLVAPSSQRRGDCRWHAVLTQRGLRAAHPLAAAVETWEEQQRGGLSFGRLTVEEMERRKYKCCSDDV